MSMQIQKTNNKPAFGCMKCVKGVNKLFKFDKSYTKELANQERDSFFKHLEDAHKDDWLLATIDKIFGNYIKKPALTHEQKAASFLIWVNKNLGIAEEKVK